MKTKTNSVALIAIILTAVFAVLSMSGSVYAATYHVDDGAGDDSWLGNDTHPWKTITHAVNTVPAGNSTADPNIINVSAGLYDNTTNGETFAITFNNSNVSLIGAGAVTTTIDGEGAGTILDINATGITVDGFNITNATNGIESDDVGGFTILNNLFFNVSDGVHLEVDETNLTTDYTVDDVLIDGNTFNISSDGVYIDIDLYADTDSDVAIGEIDILDNVFNMDATDGIDMGIWVYDLNGSSVSIGDINISENEFYDGDCGIDFGGEFDNFTDTTVTVGDFSVNDNYFEDQNDYAVYIDSYYEIEYWYGTATGTFGDLEINRNDITSAELECDGICVDEYAYWEDLVHEVSVTAGNVYIDDNNVDVNGDGIYFVYYYTEYYDNNASAILGELSIQRNNVTSDSDDGIYVGFDDCGYDLDDYTELTVGDTYIVDNTINASSNGIYLETDDFGYEAYGNSRVTAGDFYILENEIDSGDEGIYVEFYDSYDMEDYSVVTIGELHIEYNNITSDDDGIYLYYDGFGYEMYDSASLTAGDVHIEYNNIDSESGNGIEMYYDDVGSDMEYSSEVTLGDSYIEGNEIDAYYEAIYLYYDDVAYDMDDDATLLMGDTYIVDNEISGDDDGIYIEYYDYYVGSYMYYDAYAELPSYIITGNTFDVEGDGIYFYTYSNPDDNEDNAMVDYGGFFIDDNTFGCDYGIYLYYEDVCEDCYDSSGAIIRDITITNNEFHDVDSDAIYIYFDDVGYCFDDDGTVEVGDMVISDNVIDGAGGCGVYVEYSNIYSEYDAMVTMGILDILRNDISNVDADGVCIYYYVDAEDDSTISIGRALIQGNTISLCDGAGIYMYMYVDNETGAVVNLGNPVIKCNTISNCSDGIYFDGVESATIERNMIVDNGVPPSGVHLDDGSNYNEIHENCFYDNEPQAYDDGTDNDWDGNYWDPLPGGGDYNISGSAESEDTGPLDVCPLTEPPAALNLIKTDDVSGCTEVGDTITYTICYDNLQNICAAVYNVTINDTLPAGVTFVSASHGGSYDAGTRNITWDIGTVQAEALETCVTLNVTVNTDTEGQTLTNCATISNDETEPTTACEDTDVCEGEPTPTPTPYPTPTNYEPVPVLTPAGVALMIGLLAVAGFVTLRRRE